MVYQVTQPNHHLTVQVSYECKMASSILSVMLEDISRTTLSLRNLDTVNGFKHCMLEIFVSNWTILQERRGLEITGRDNT